MIVKRLTLANVRAIESAEFSFRPGLNLIVGVNGVGKTTVLEMIARELAHTVKASSRAKVVPPSIGQSDIRHGAVSATVALHLEIGGQTLSVSEQQTRAEFTLQRPGALASEVEVHARGLHRRGRLKKAQREAEETAAARTEPTFVPSHSAFGQAAHAEPSRVLAVYFSTERARPSTSTAKKSRAVASENAAYVEAFTGRELRLDAFAEWIHVLRETSHERSEATSILSSLESAVRRFVPGYLGLEASDTPPRQLRIVRTATERCSADRLSEAERQLLLKVLRATNEQMSSNWLPAHPDADDASVRAARFEIAREYVLKYMPGFGQIEGPIERLPQELEDKTLTEGLGRSIEIDRLPCTLEASHLSDGERGLLALVLDLTRRLAQANPGLPDPAASAAAVVLIDELELHLHPGWQRQAVHNLQAAFPRCQFIATTHSPQVIGEVEHDRIQIIASGRVYSPTHSYGVDSSRLLEEVMEADPRAKEVQDLLAEVSTTIGRQDFTRGRELLGKLVDRLGENDPEVTRIRTLLDFVEGHE